MFCYGHIFESYGSKGLRHFKMLWTSKEHFKASNAYERVSQRRVSCKHARTVVNKTGSLVKYVYINGPTWLGSWEGQSLFDICSGLTRVDANHWTHIPEACADLINRKVKANVIGVSIVSGFVLTWTLTSVLSNIVSLYVLKSL